MLNAPRPRAAPPPPRYVGLMIGVALVALLLGGAGVLVAARGPRTAASAAPPVEAPSALAIVPIPSASAIAALPSGEITSPVASASPVAKHAAPPKARGSAAATSTPAAAAPPVATEAAAASFNPGSATVMLGALTTERVRDDAVRKKTSALQPQLTSCYQDALRAIGSAKGGSVQIQMSIDERGNVTPLVLTKEFPSFASCAQRAMAGMRIDPAALETGGGGNATQWLTLRP